jgi:hypothetical protein
MTGPGWTYEQGTSMQIGNARLAWLLSAAMIAAVSTTAAKADSDQDQQGGWGVQGWGPGPQGQGPQVSWIGPLGLRGGYGFTGEAACLFAPGSGPAPTPGVAMPNAGFRPNLQPNDAVPGSSTDAFSSSFAVEGIRVFRGDGTGTVKGTSVGITVRPTPGPNGYPSFPPSADVENFSYDFKYTVNGDGSWSSTSVPNTYVGTFVGGPRTGQTDKIDAIPPINGMISQDGNTLTGAHTAAAVETITFSNGDVWPRICHRSRIYINLPGFSFLGGNQ